MSNSPRIFASIAFVLLLLGTSTVHAETLQASLARIYGTDVEGLRILREGGAKLGDVLVAERVPTGAYVVEVQLRLNEATARYPLKLQRDGEAWSLEWQPRAAYAGALLSMARSGALPAATTGLAWDSTARLPALPVIGTRKRFVTPFGEVALDDHAEGKSQGDLDISPGLVQAMHSWVRRVLDEDPGPGGIDLILDGQLSWQAANKILFNASVVGLFQVTIVTAANGLDVLQVASPVAASRFTTPPRIVAMYALENGYGVRLSEGSTIVESDGCADQMSACVADEAEFAGLVRGFVVKTEPTMFAAGRELTVAQVMPFLVQMDVLAALGAHRLVVGYVQR